MTSANPTNQGEIDLNVAISQMAEGDRFEEDERRGVRDPRTGRFTQHSDFGADDKLNVKFTTEPVFSKKETFLAGGVHKYVDMEFVTITVPGNRDLMVHAPATDFYQWRFPFEYAAFKRGQDAAVTGTPLEIWAALNPSQIQELKYHGIRTIEQIATLSDSSSGVMRGFYSLKHKAQQFLDEAKDAAANGALRAQLEEQQARHASEMQAMEERLMAVMQGNAQKDGKARKDDKATD